MRYIQLGTIVQQCIGAVLNDFGKVCKEKLQDFEFEHNMGEWKVTGERATSVFGGDKNPQRDSALSQHK